MKPIPEDAIDKIPDSITRDRESLETAADRGLYVLFFMAAEHPLELEFPLILSNGIEVWRLPAPWESESAGDSATLAHANELLVHIKRNAKEYNEALEASALPLAEKIATMAPADSAALWDYCNSVAMILETEEGNEVYHPLNLSEETTKMFEAIMPEEAS